ncbi:MAG TPA: plasmid pRiA4b ORF-3 family protein [Phycisphaerae bacterium]|nr:plasmid pRiA4b ORF-3 family protein [Phycisphaerae bacterium]
MAKRKSAEGRRVRKDDRLFTLEVFIFSGPMTEEFTKKNKVISRTIQIRGDQTLEELHDVIFDAFGRFDGHMYEYQIGGKRPMDPKARRYGLGDGYEGSGLDSPDLAGDVTRTTIGSLDLKVDDAFGYWFDFGDDWWHQINVVSIEDKAPRGKYPKVTKRVGKSPPQYVDWGEEDDD